MNNKPEKQRNDLIQMFKKANSTSLGSAYLKYKAMLGNSNIEELFNKKELGDVQYNLSKCCHYEASKFYDAGKFDDAPTPEHLINDTVLSIKNKFKMP